MTSSLIHKAVMKRITSSKLLQNADILDYMVRISI